MRQKAGGVRQRRVALAVVAALAVNPGVTIADGGRLELAPVSSAARSGLLVVESDPAGATVYVGGQLTGQTPLQLASLPVGDHRVRLVKDGYLENARVVAVGAVPRTVRVRLTPDAGFSPAAQFTTGGGGGGRSKRPLILALAAGGGVAAFLLLRNGDDNRANRAPTVGSVSFFPTTAIVATNVTFSTVGAQDPDGDSLTFAWDFGDGGTGTGATPQHAYASANTYTVKVTVSDGKNSGSATGSLDVRDLTATWIGTLTAPVTPIDTTINLTQSGTTSLTGTYMDSLARSGPVTGTVNATSRRVTLDITLNVGTLRFVGDPDPTVTTLTGVGNGQGLSDAQWTMSRP